MLRRILHDLLSFAHNNRITVSKVAESWNDDAGEMLGCHRTDNASGANVAGVAGRCSLKVENFEVSAV